MTADSSIESGPTNARDGRPHLSEAFFSASVLSRVKRGACGRRRPRQWWSERWLAPGLNTQIDQSGARIRTKRQESQIESTCNLINGGFFLLCWVNGGHCSERMGSSIEHTPGDLLGSSSDGIAAHDEPAERVPDQDERGFEAGAAGHLVQLRGNVSGRRGVRQAAAPQPNPERS